jgi:hypothetical protein
MAVNKLDYIGKRVMWSDIVHNFPSKWVFIKDCNFDGIEIKDGIVEEIVSDDERDNYIDKYFKPGTEMCRTTSEPFGGYINGRIVD